MMIKAIRWGGVKTPYTSPDIEAINLASRTVLCQSDNIDDANSGTLKYYDWSGSLEEVD